MAFNRGIICVCFMVILPVWGRSQVFTDKLKQFISSTAFTSSGLQYENEVRAFYNNNGFRYSWFSKQNSDLSLLVNYIQHSPDLGLKPEDYQPALFGSYATGVYSPAVEQDSLQAEIRFTDAAIHLLHDVLMGNHAELLSYNGLDYQPSCYDIPAILNTYLGAGRFSVLLNEQESKQPEYLAVKNKLNLFHEPNVISL